MSRINTLPKPNARNESPNIIIVVFSVSSTSPNNGGARRIFQAASHSAAGSASPIKMPSSRRLNSFWPSPMAVQPLTSNGISTGNESFDISIREWRPDRLRRLTSSRQKPPACHRKKKCSQTTARLTASAKIHSGWREIVFASRRRFAFAAIKSA